MIINSQPIGLTICAMFAGFAAYICPVVVASFILTGLAGFALGAATIMVMVDTMDGRKQ
jgi:hypothetical protein